MIGSWVEQEGNSEETGKELRRRTEHIHGRIFGEELGKGSLKFTIATFSVLS